MKWLARFAGITLLLLGAAIVADAMFGLSWAGLARSLPEGWRTYGDSRLTLWILTHIASPLLATLGLTLLLASFSGRNRLGNVFLAIGVGLCLQGTFPCLWMYRLETSAETGTLIVTQPAGMLAVLCLMFSTPMGVVFLICAYFLKRSASQSQPPSKHKDS